MKSAIIVLSSLLAATVSTSDILLKADPVQTPEELKLRHDFAAMRGLIDGYYEGMYRRPKYAVKKECLDDKAVKDVLVIQNATTQKGFSAETIIVPMADLWFMYIQYCEFDDALYDYAVWCDTNDCTAKYMGQALLKKVFQVTTVANELAAQIAEEKPLETDYKAIESYFLKMGSAVGKLLRYATDFDPTQLNIPK